MNYDIFADEEENKVETPVVETKKEPVIETTEDEVVTEDEETQEENDKEEQQKEDKKIIEVEKDFPKKDLGVGGAAFVDEFLKFATDEQMQILKRGEKTLSGFWNWSYSKVKSEYIKCYGSVNGGVFRDVSSLAEEYFSDAVKEGDIVECEKYKVKTPTQPNTEKKEEKKTTKRKNAKKAVVEVAKMAVEDAKKESEEKKSKVDSDKEVAKIRERIAFLLGNK